MATRTICTTSIKHSPVTDEAAFLRSIANAPDDDAPRLIYADWLEERADLRGEYVRLDVERVRIPNTDTKSRAALDERMNGLVPQLDRGWVDRLKFTRRLSPLMRLDLYVVTGGKGMIEVRGGEQEDAVLLVEGRPIALNWNDCQGSVGQYLVFTSHTRGNEYARQLAEFVSGQYDLNCPFAEQISPLLSTFADGIYWLHFIPSTDITGFEVQGYPSPAPGDRRLLEYYPFADHNLIGTQAHESLDKERVKYYRAQIRSKRRPIILTAATENAWCEFVIDGHHKLEAYLRENVKPSILNIIRWDAPTIGLTEGIGYLPRGHAGIAAYRRAKRS